MIIKTSDIDYNCDKTINIFIDDISPNDIIDSINSDKFFGFNDEKNYNYDKKYTTNNDVALFYINHSDLSRMMMRNDKDFLKPDDYEKFTKFAAKRNEDDKIYDMLMKKNLLMCLWRENSLDAITGVLMDLICYCFHTQEVVILNIDRHLKYSSKKLMLYTTAIIAATRLNKKLILITDDISCILLTSVLNHSNSINLFDKGDKIKEFKKLCQKINHSIKAGLDVGKDVVVS